MFFRKIIFFLFLLILISSCSNPNKDFFVNETSQVIENIFTVKGKIVNFYIVKDDKNLVCFDTGDNIDEIKKELVKININPLDVNYIFFTHSDYDHAGCLELFPNAKIYLSKDEEQMITGKKARMLFFFNKSIKNYTLLNDNETITIGNLKITGISMPGHTPGSMAYVLNDNILFTGDALLLKDNKVTNFPKFYTIDMETHKNSIKKIAGFENIKYLFTAHSGFTDNFNEAIKDWK
ncbi:MAG: hypothetical protein A2086_04150 [Spirochaetes bacterium GWD1_27_9]|nr:MAG: hypothetical protein A2Z98_06485 [Spirochaetes bacterium GWB1_27_13]OHD27543.1 MAG: hypothetical protein A2Y34_13805 [Spirochaetes bacterium GWC1_27_15]OHD44738.1 MAG: hypothetical protein A2086_04150 [Spirochaetes bacterium GWD1_27_9]